MVKNRVELKCDNMIYTAKYNAMLYIFVLCFAD